MSLPARELHHSPYRPRYTAEFKRDAVALALSSEKTITEVARDLGVSPEGSARVGEAGEGRPR
ncbi:transposase [Streptomyces sp. NPDC091219]|uniref:transposase n=1 Tax=Streptomyces sp. NPDC091219 TaxID=3155193 RepID=UPI00344E8E45